MRTLAALVSMPNSEVTVDVPRQRKCAICSNSCGRLVRAVMQEASFPVRGLRSATPDGAKPPLPKQRYPTRVAGALGMLS